MYLIEFDGKKFALDLNKLMEWTLETLPREKNNTTSVTCVYDSVVEDEEFPDASSISDMGLVRKEESEVKTSLNDTTLNFRYDMIKNLLTVLTTMFISPDGQVLNSTSVDDFPFPQVLAFNTLVSMGILIEL